MQKLFRPTLAFLHDILMVPIAFYMSFYFRLGNETDIYFDPDVIFAALIFTGTAAVFFLYFKMYKGVWRYASIHDLANIVKATTLTVLVFIAISFFVTRLDDIPRSIPLMSWFIIIMLLSGSRLFYRLMKDRSFSNVFAKLDTRERIPVLLAGAGDEADLFIRSMGHDLTKLYEICGVLAQKKTRVGRYIRNVPILGTLEDYAEVLKKLKGEGVEIQRLILTKPRREMSGEMVEHLLETSRQFGVTLSRIPKLTDFQDPQKESTFAERPIAIEDLLGRPQSHLNISEIQDFLTGRIILITGAGGSIGQEICRQVAQFLPKEVILVEQCEFNLYQIDQIMTESFPGLKLHSYLADVKNLPEMRRIFAERKPEIIFHAAALKHVPLAEQNPRETVFTNIFGTKNMADLALDFQCKAMVCISTDKAVNPTNIMGATKRAAEAYCQALDSDMSVTTRFITVRFGNVLGSTGSVVPLFQRQIQKGGPITITHPEIKRYFMTIKEAVKLVLQASAFGLSHEGEKGGLFVLDMGKPIKITHLAEQMIKLAGLKPYEDIAITFTGLRPGEKLYEELFDANENLVPSGAEGILSAHPRPSDRQFYEKQFKVIFELCQKGAGFKEVATALQTIVPEYQPQV